MSETSSRWAVGLMSGTSLDGIDAALIRSDGRSQVEFGPAATSAYDDAFRAKLRSTLGGAGPVAEVERELTLRHARAVEALLAGATVPRDAIAVIGFHGHTILHAPERGRTWQIGDGALLAAETGIDVVADFRSRDVTAGGQGAPFAPFYHAALAAGLERPLAVLNLGGVGNVTWIGRGEDQVIAFDTGPGNALIDNWVSAHDGKAYDTGGTLARAGRLDETALAALLASPDFDRPAPKSLDRDAFDPTPVAGLSPEDGAATLTAFTAASVAKAEALFPEAPLRWLVTEAGGTIRR